MFDPPSYKLGKKIGQIDNFDEYYQFKNDIKKYDNTFNIIHTHRRNKELKSDFINNREINLLFDEKNTRIIRGLNLRFTNLECVNILICCNRLYDNNRRIKTQIIYNTCNKINKIIINYKFAYVRSQQIPSNALQLNYLTNNLNTMYLNGLCEQKKIAHVNLPSSIKSINLKNFNIIAPCNLKYLSTENFSLLKKYPQKLKVLIIAPKCQHLKNNFKKVEIVELTSSCDCDCINNFNIEYKTLFLNINDTTSEHNKANYYICNNMQNLIINIMNNCNLDHIVPLNIQKNLNYLAINNLCVQQNNNVQQLIRKSLNVNFFDLINPLLHNHKKYYTSFNINVKVSSCDSINKQLITKNPRVYCKYYMSVIKYINVNSQITFNLSQLDFFIV